MKISYNPKSSQAAITSQTAANDDIIFDLYASKLWAKGVRIGADWADISSKPSSLKNPHALTISLNGTSQGPYDGSAAKNINITPGSIGAATSEHNHDNRYVRKWTGVYGDANKFLKLAIADEKGWIRLEVSDSNNSLTAGYGIYMIGWGYHGNNGTDTLFARCLYANDSRYTTALKIVRTSRNNYDFYFQFASGSSYPSYTINYSSSVSSIDCTVTAIDTIPTATWTSSLSALQLNASQVDWSGITNKPSVFNPAAHTHTVFKNNLMIKGTNGISDSASIHLGIGDSDTGFKWISDGKCQIYANNSAVGEWTSGGMNWFKNPTVNGNKVWNAGNDGSESGLDADLLDGWHLDSIRKNVGYSWSAKYRINNWSRIIKIDNYSNILLAINFAQNNQASNHLYLISTGYGCGNIVQLGSNGYNGNSAIKIRLTENTATSHNVEIYSTYGYNDATELSINCNYTRIDGNSTITTYLIYTAGGGTVRKEITSSYSKIVANLQGNSDTTTKLQTPRQINGTNFDGSANITTSYWGTTRTISLTGAVTGSVSTNGSGNITINTTYGTGNITNLDSRYVNVTGDTMTGTLTTVTTGSNSYNQGIRINRTATNQWATLLIGKSGTATTGTGTSTAGDGAWLIATPASSNSLIFNLNSASETVGLCLKGHGNTDIKWNNNTIWHAGNDGSGSGLDADTVDGAHLIKNGSGTGIKQVYHFNTQGANTSYIKLGTLPTVSVTGLSTSKVMFTVKGGINFGGTNESVYEVAASTRGSIQVTSTLVRGNRELKFGYVSTSSNVEIWMAYDGSYRGVTEVEVSSSINFTLTMTETTTKPSDFVEGSYRILASIEDNVASATKLQTPRSIWGNLFNGTKDINDSIVFPNIGDTATSNKISWSSSSNGADIYYQTTATDQGNLVLNVKDDTNAYIQLALNGVFKSHFDVANSYWTGRSALADKWTTARTFTIGNTAKNVDGSGNVSWSLAEIGVNDTWRAVQVNGTSIGNNTLNLCGSTYIGLTNVNGKVTFSLVGSGTTANQAILSNGTANGWTLKTLNIANWDTAYNFVSTITGEDADKVINKWEEIVNFLAGITEDNKLNTLLNSKLSIQQLSAKDILTTKTNNALYWVNTKGTASSITTGPFTDHPYALLSVTNYNQNAENNKFFYRSRLAFSSAGDIKVASCHHENEYKQDETWYNVLTSKNSGINGSTIKLNGTSITVYSSSTADGRYVKKSGDTMTGALNFANNAWNNVGDDVAIGDHNIAGCLGIKGLNADPGIAFYNSSNTLLSKLVGTTNQFQRVSGNNTYNILDNSTTHINNNTITINGSSITVSKSDHTHSYLFIRDERNSYPGQIVESQRMQPLFMSNRPLGIQNDGEYYDTLVFRSWRGGTAGNENALLFSKNTKSLYHTQFPFGSTDSWGTPLLIIDSANIGSQSVNYANSAGNADTLDNYHANGLFTALSNSNRGISLTVGGTTKSLSNISVGDADKLDGYHANTIYNAPSFIVSNPNTSNTYVLLATITISGTSLSCAEFTTLFQNRECLDSSSFILSGAIRRDSTTRVTATLSYITLHTKTPKNIYLRSDDGVTFLVYIQSAAGSWTTYYKVIPIVDSGNIKYSNTGTTSPISGSVLNITATKGGNVNYASSAESASTATKLTSSAGNAALPIYFSDGKPVACTASSVFSNLSNSGNNLSITVAGQNRTLTVGYATSAGSATKVIVNQNTTNDTNYPLVWSNQNNTNNATENQLFKSWQGLYYNPKNKRLFVGGSVSTVNINATGTVTSAGFKHSGVTKNADQYVLTAGGGYTFLNQASNELAHEFSKDITVTSEWADIEDFYGGNQNFLTQPGTYIVQVYYNDSSADGMYEGYFSGIMSWFTKTTNSNNADEIILHRVGHAYANTIYLRTRESLESETNPYTKLQISANTTLKQHTYKFKFKRIC